MSTVNGYPLMMRVLTATDPTYPGFQPCAIAAPAHTAIVADFNKAPRRNGQRNSRQRGKR